MPKSSKGSSKPTSKDIQNLVNQASSGGLSKKGIVGLVLSGILLFFGGATAGGLVTNKVKNDNPVVIQDPNSLTQYLPKMAPDVDIPAQQADDVSYHVLSVGNGEFTYVQKGNKAVLLDAGRGRSGKTVVEPLTIWRTTSVGWDYVANDFEINGVTEIEAIFISHAHEDHTWLLGNVIDNMPVKDIIMPATNFTDTTNSINAKGKGINIIGGANHVQFYTYLGIQFENLSFQINHDELVSAGESNTNNSSIVLRFQIGDKWILFTGDADRGEANLTNKALLNAINDPNKPIYLYVLPHHGSNVSANELFLDYVGKTIKYALISGGFATEEWKNYASAFQFPAVETLNFLKEKASQAEVYVTGALPLAPLKTDQNFYSQVKGYNHSYLFRGSKLTSSQKEYNFYTSPKTIIHFEDEQKPEN